MARRDLASIELFIRTLQSSDAAAIQKQAHVLEHKKLGLELARIRQQGVREKGQLKLLEMDTRLRAEQSRAQMHIQMENLKLDKVKQLEASNESLMRMQLSVKGHQMQMLQMLMNARSMIGEENSRRLRDQLAASTAAANLYPVLAQMRLDFGTEEANSLAAMQQMFLFVEADGENLRILGEFDNLKDAWKKMPGKGDFSDELIASDWLDKVKNVYLKMAGKVMKENGYTDLDQIDSAKQSELVREASRQAFMGGEHVSHGIVATAAEARLGDRASQKRTEFNQKAIDEFKAADPGNAAKFAAMTPEQQAQMGVKEYENYLMGFVRTGKGDDFFHFDKSSKYTDKGWMPTKANDAYGNMEIAVVPGLTGLLPSFVMNQGNRLQAERAAGMIGATVRMDMGRLVNQVAGLATGVQPLDMNSIVESANSILSGNDLDASLAAMGAEMGEELYGTMRKTQDATGVDLGLGGDGLNPPTPAPQEGAGIQIPAPDIVNTEGAAANPNKVPVDTSSRELYGGPDLSGYMSNPQRQY